MGINDILSKKIMVIDDDYYDRKCIEEVLKRAGYKNVSVIEDTREGLEIIRKHKPEIIIIDVVLHHIDGFDLCRQIRKIPDYHPKIIMATGHMEAVIVKKAVASGADEIVEKKEDFQEITKTLKRIISA